MGKLFVPLSETNFTVQYGDFKFYFSTQLRATNFSNKARYTIAYVENQLNKIYYLKVDATFLALNKLYLSIENRGYRIEYKGMKVPRNVGISWELEGLINE